MDWCNAQTGRIGVARVVIPALVGLVSAGCAGPDPMFTDGGMDYTLTSDSLSCLPDNNGIIERDEMVFRAGLAAQYRVNPAGTLDTLDPNGQVINGKLEWDFSSLRGQVMTLKVESVSDKWYGKHFPSGDIAIVTSAAGDTLQVLGVEQNRVLLLGIASRKPNHTLMVYDPPISAMRFPMKVGNRFSSTGATKAGAKFNGLAIATNDTYEVAINREGVLRLPNLKLHRALLIETKVTARTVGGVTAVTRQLQWFSECYGEVVRALSKTDEKNALFTQATELRKLAF